MAFEIRDKGAIRPLSEIGATLNQYSPEERAVVRGVLLSIYRQQNPGVQFSESDFDDELAGIVKPEVKPAVEPPPPSLIDKAVQAGKGAVAAGADAVSSAVPGDEGKGKIRRFWDYLNRPGMGLYDLVDKEAVQNLEDFPKLIHEDADALAAEVESPAAKFGLKTLGNAGWAAGEVGKSLPTALGILAETKPAQAAVGAVLGAGGRAIAAPFKLGARLAGKVPAAVDAVLPGTTSQIRSLAARAGEAAAPAVAGAKSVWDELSAAFRPPKFEPAPLPVDPQDALAAMRGGEGPLPVNLPQEALEAMRGGSAAPVQTTKDALTEAVERLNRRGPSVPPAGVPVDELKNQALKGAKKKIRL